MTEKTDPKESPCLPCREENPTRFLYIKQLFRADAMNKMIGFAEYRGFGNATYADGTFRDNVQTVFLRKDDKEMPREVSAVFDRIKDVSAKLGEFFDIEVYPDELESVQVARYMPGNFYGQHIDHDSGLANLKHDRKISLYCSMTQNGVLDLEGERIFVGCGDAVAYPSNMFHAAPQQQEGASRYSFAAWILGPNWK